MKTIYQVAAKDYVLLHTRTVGDGEPLPSHCVRVAPPDIPTGQAARWDATKPDYEPGFGEAGAGEWVIEDDHRNDDLYQTADGAQYTIGAEINDKTYNGLGAIPNWLTGTARPSKFHVWKRGKWVLDADAKVENDAATLRAQRDAAISATDWIVIRHRDQIDANIDTTLTPEQYETLLEYRQSLRNLSDQPAFPDIDLPVKPDFI